jgi:hypothetical protein
VEGEGERDLGKGRAQSGGLMSSIQFWRADKAAFQFNREGKKESAGLLLTLLWPENLPVHAKGEPALKVLWYRR